MHAWPVHTTKLVAVHKTLSYTTCRIEQLVVDSFMLRRYGVSIAKPHR